MKRTLSTYEVAHALLDDDNAGWTYKGAFALAEILEQYEEDTGEELELDCVALRCEWNEDTAEDLLNNYGQPGETLEELIERVNDNGMLITVEDNDPVTYLYQAF